MPNFPHVVPSGINIVPYTSGTDTIGSPTQPFQAVYAGSGVFASNVYAGSNVYINGNPIGYQLVQTVNFSNVATVRISGLSNETAYELKWYVWHSGTAGTTNINFNNDTANKYGWATWLNTPGGTASNGSNADTKIQTQVFTTATTYELLNIQFRSMLVNTSGVMIAGQGGLNGIYNSANSVENMTFHGLYQGSVGSTLTEIDFTTTAGLYQSGTVYLYKLG